MLYLLLFYLALCLVSVKIAGPRTFHQDYTDQKNTAAMNGVFVGLVFLSHVSGYLTLDDTLPNRIFFAMNIDQLVVTSFLFYSGYGIFCSVRAKGLPYVKRIPVHRFLKTWLHFAIACGVFMLMNLALGISYSRKTNLLALTGYVGIGNSNWYIFVILILYLVVTAAFLIAKQRLYLGAGLVTAAVIALTVFFHLIHLPSYYYNTMLCFAAGMWYAACKEKLDKFLLKSNGCYLAGLAAAGAGMIAARILCRFFGQLAYPIFASFFILVVVLLTIKVQLRNPMLTFLGTHVFEIYVFQRIPMIILEKAGLSAEHPYVYVVICAAVTVLLAFVFQKCFQALDQKLFAPKKKPD